MSYSISSSNPIEFLNPNRIWKIGHKGHLREVDVSGILNISGNMHFTNQITGYHLNLSGDVSFNQNLNVYGDVLFNQNLHVSGNTRFKISPYQEIDTDLSYIYYSGSFGLAKHCLPKQPDQTNKNLIVNTNSKYTELTAANTTDIVNSLELRRFMVIGFNGYYASSTNGIYWDISGTTSTNLLKQVIWVKEQSKFVIIGDNGYVAISSDSYNIDISSTIISVNTLNSIAWSPQLGIYLTVGKSNSSLPFTATSIDAINWSNNIIYDDIQVLSSVIWVPELKRFIVVGSYSPNGGIDYHGFYMSTLDGKNWDISGIILADNDNQFKSVIWSPELSRIVAVGESGFYATAKAEKDSLIWDYSGNISSIDKYNKVIWISQLQRFVAIGDKSPFGHMISSLDGINWDLSNDLPRVSTSICWAEDLGKLLITDTNGKIYYTNPKHVFQTTYNIFQDAMLQELEVNGDASFNSNFDIEDHLIVHGDVSFNSSLDLIGQFRVHGDVSFNSSVDLSNQLRVHGDVSLNNRLDVSGITTLSDHLLTNSSYVKVPVSYSTFAVAKGVDLSSNITQIYGTWHDLSADGYTVTINPVSINSYIKLDFKVNYICSNETDQTISFRVKNNHNEIIYADLSLGTTTGVTNKGIYNGLYIDFSGYNAPVTYYLEYLIADGANNIEFLMVDDANNNIDVSSGVLGHNHGNSNIVIAQELYIPVEIPKS